MATGAAVDPDSGAHGTANRAIACPSDSEASRGACTGPRRDPCTRAESRPTRNREHRRTLVGDGLRVKILFDTTGFLDPNEAGGGKSLQVAQNG